MPKIVKIPLIIIAGFLALIMITWGLLQLNSVQNFILNKLTNKVSRSLGVKLSASHIKIHYFDHVELTDVYLEDQQGDTLFYFQTLEANYDLFSWSSTTISFDKVALSGAAINIGIPKGQDQLNLQFLIDYFQPKDSLSKSPSPTIRIKNVTLTNTRFRYFNSDGATPESRLFNENDMFFSNLNAELKNVVLINDSMHFISKNLEVKEQSGLVINQLKAECIISSTLMQYKDLELITPHSALGNFLRFEYSSYSDFADFISAVNIDASLENSNIQTTDLVYFYTGLEDFQENIQISGLVSGTIDRLKGKNLNVKIGKHTSYQGKAKITGIPDMENTYYDFDGDEFKTTIQELVDILHIDQVPEEVLMLNKIKFVGSFKGFTREFVSYGQLSTDLGNATTDLKFKINPDGTEVYSGSIASKSMELGKLLHNSSIGKTGFALTIEGEGLRSENLDATVKGQVSFIEFNNYSYSNIRVNGNFKQDIFEGIANINDPNLQLSFDGSINANKETPYTRAKTIVKKANLQTLGIGNKLSFVSLIGEVDLQGSTIDELIGTISIDSLVWTDNERIVPVEYLELVISNNNGIQRMDIQSALLDASVKGEYKLSELGNIANDVIKLAETTADNIKPTVPASNLIVSLNLKEFHPLYEEYLNGLLFNDANLNLAYTADNGTLIATSTINQLKFSSIATSKLDINLSKTNFSNESQLDFNADDFALNDSLLFYHVTGKSVYSGNQLDFKIDGIRDSSLCAIVDGHLVSENDSVSVFINEVDAVINNKLWHMGKTDFANIVYSNGLTELFYFDFRNKDEIIFFDGAFGDDITKINVVFDQFLLDNANPFLASYDLELHGIANGYVDLTYREGYPIFESDFVIDNLAVDDDTLGHFIMVSESGVSPLDVLVDGRVESGLLDGMTINGNVDFNTPKDALHINLRTEKSSIQPFEKYLEGLASNLSGYSTVNLQLLGSLDKPVVTGTTELTELAFTVDYLQTQYTAHAIVEVGNNYFRLKDAEIQDRFGSKGKATGQITHRNYDNFGFDLSIKDLKNFECLNTTRKDNELFYGTAYADGYMEVKGPLEDILLLITAKSRKGTKIYIPLDNTGSDNQLSYVQFVNLREDNNRLKEMNLASDGVQMDFNLEITNDADVELIFDELIGDKIKGNGHGNLRMEVNTYGEFNMYGELIIDKGDYLFTAFNFINKYFVVTPGSKMSWDGDPYNATLNLVAIKREYPVPSSLLAGIVTENLDDYNTPIPVDCELILSGLLFNPDIDFGISFPSQNSLSSSSNSTFNTVMERVRQDKEELDRQVFALLALGTFIPPSFANTSQIINANTGGQSSVNSTITNSVNNSLSDFVSSQLSNWLSQIDPRWQVGVDYQIASTDAAKAELILSLKRKFLNDRLELQGSYDANSTTGSRPYDVNVQYNLSKDGSFKIKGFQRNANDPTLGNLSNVTTSGIGFFYRHQFDHFWWEKK